ncbi:metallophosphoesterase, partial [Stenotrophomonas maltophilia]|nr:metallophosphoesterase [Stenotrophomonas maltophilia]
MSRYRPSLMTALLLPLLACSAGTTQAREAAAPADHVQADGPYVFRQGDQLQARWICADKVESRTLAAGATGTDIAPRCGYEHTVHVAAP